MSEFKSLDDVIGYLTNVAEFELRHTEHIKIPDGHMTVISENYNIMFDAIQWITEKLEQPQLNENQKDLVVWMQDNECSADDPLESISDLFLEGTPSEHFPDLPLSCVEAAYQSLNKKQKLELVKEYVKKAFGTGGRKCLDV